MTLIVKGSWTQLPQPPRVWYPHSAGGSWLNYLIWCSLNNQSINGNIDNFDYPALESIVNSQSDIKYQNYIQCREHNINWDDCEIILGSSRTWFNFFLNFQKKNGREDSVRSYQIASQYAGWMRRNISFNLDWCLIWTDSRQFLDKLAELTGLELPMNTGAEQAFAQYCSGWDFEPQSGDLEVYQRAVYDFATDQEITDRQARLQRAREIVYTTWYRI